MGGRDEVHVSLISKFSHSWRVMCKLSMTDDLLCRSSCITGSAHISGCIVNGSLLSIIVIVLIHVHVHVHVAACIHGLILTHAQFLH